MDIYPNFLYREGLEGFPLLAGALAQEANNTSAVRSIGLIVIDTLSCRYPSCFSESHSALTSALLCVDYASHHEYLLA
jgi:hypothetical protein